MHRSSESIAALAAALAKAQAQLVNPEKSLTATILLDRGGGARTFRYAPLSSGLDIVRKTLGQHEIATIQTTAVNPTNSTVSLTTLLAHSSGEWISSDWPVCRLADIGMPQRMGTALTYARRYSLFTLVGIAGEDDTDAPNLDAGGIELPSDEQSNENGTLTAPPNSFAPVLKEPAQATTRSRVHTIRMVAVLAPDKSAALRAEFISEITFLASIEEATSWARRRLPSKNTLTSDDAHSIEQAFEARLEQLGQGTLSGNEAEPEPSASIASNGGPRKRTLSKRTFKIEKANLSLKEPRRKRDKSHLRLVAAQACLVCGRRPSDAHHLRFTQPRALSRRVSDEFTVPLCRTHHREAHRFGDEKSWWVALGIDPLLTATELWDRSKGTRSNGTGAALQ